MPPAKQTPEDIRRAYVDLAFDEAYIIREELYGNESDGTVGLYARRKANREELRRMRDSGLLSDEQRGELAELYPNRQRNSEEAEAETGAAENAEEAA